MLHFPVVQSFNAGKLYAKKFPGKLFYFYIDSCLSMNRFSASINSIWSNQPLALALVRLCLDAANCFQ
jgi:hypothetical protein